MGTEIDGVNGIIKNTTSDGDITIKGNDGGSEVTAMSFDMSAAGIATLTAGLKLTGTTPTLTVGDGGAEDTKILFDGNAQNFYIGLDDSADDLLIGLGSTVGTTPAIAINENNQVTLPDGQMEIIVTGNFPNLTLISTDEDANFGPKLRLYRNSANPANDDVLGVIDFDGRNNASQDVVYARIQSEIMGIADGSEQGQLEFDVMVSGTLRNVLMVDRSEVCINEDSQDIDFRVESNGNANMLHVNGGSNLVGIGADPDLGAGLHIKSGDSGASVNSARDELVIEGSGNVGMTILSGTSSVGGVGFGDSGGNLQGLMQYNHATDNFEFNTNSSANPLVLNDTGQLSTSGEVAPDTDAGGLTLDQNATDGNILTMKSSDIAHGFTGGTETDSYATFGKASGTDGGLVIQGFHEGQGFGIQMMAHCKTAGFTASSTSGFGHLDFIAHGSNGSTGTAALEADENIMSVRNGGNVKFIVKGDGDLFADGTLSAYDTYEDAQLVRAFDLSHGKNVINSTFDKYVKYNHETLADANLVGREEDGTPNHFINVTGMQRLHNGAIWQQYEKTQKLTNAFYKLAQKTIGKEEADKLLTEEEIKLLN